jgi:hydrogenase-4 component F
MALLEYAVAGLAALALIAPSRSHRHMQAVTVLHAAACMFLSAHALATLRLPAYFGPGGYLFMDHLGLYEAFVASAVFLVAAVYAGGYVEGLISDGELRRGNLRVFYAAYNLLLVSTVWSFFANNLALFWIFAELTTFFSAVLIAILSSRKNVEASLRYVFITSVSMLFTFIGLVLLFAVAKHTLGEGTLSWDVLLANAKDFPPGPMAGTFILVCLGFGAKAGIAPFHTWLPHAHAKAPSAVSAILSGALLNVGMYGIIRMYAIARQTHAEPQVAKLLVGFGLLSMFIAAFTMLQNRNLKKLIAFSSIEHMGLMLVGVGLGTPAAMFWTLYHTIAHSFTKALLFLSAGVLHRQYHSNKAENMKDAIRLQPLASLGLAAGAAAIAGMPPFPIFFSKLFILVEVANASVPLLFAVLFLLLLASVALAVYLVRLLSNVSQHGETAQTKLYVPDADMKAAIWALLALVLLLGALFPFGLDRLLTRILSDLRMLT